jgi:hypothetical protein
MARATACVTSIRPRVFTAKIRSQMSASISSQLHRRLCRRVFARSRRSAAPVLTDDKPANSFTLDLEEIVRLSPERHISRSFWRGTPDREPGADHRDLQIQPNPVGPDSLTVMITIPLRASLVKTQPATVLGGRLGAPTGERCASPTAVTEYRADPRVVAPPRAGHFPAIENPAALTNELIEWCHMSWSA